MRHSYLSSAPQRFAVISDVHLRNPKDNLTQKFLETVSQLPTEHKIEALFLNGDIFDFIAVSSTFFLKFWNSVFDTLKNLKKQGVAVYFSEGNHDFGFENFRNGFLDDCFTQYGDVSFSFEHPTLGYCWVQHADDVVCPKSYLTFRKLVKSWGFQKATSILVPGFVMQKIFTKYAQISRSQDAYRSCSEDFLKSCLTIFFTAQEKHPDTFIMGHIHQDVDLIHQKTHVLCGPSWLTEPNVLVCGQEGHQRFKLI